jgi:2-polyprenyl-6-methoxyphenol hydroxylase-like FAD-dependent oxidoreductase
MHTDSSRAFSIYTALKFEKFREVPEEPHGVPAEEAAGHHPWAAGNHTKNQPRSCIQWALFTAKPMNKGRAFPKYT